MRDKDRHRADTTPARGDAIRWRFPPAGVRSSRSLRSSGSQGLDPAPWGDGCDPPDRTGRSATLERRALQRPLARVCRHLRGDGATPRPPWRATAAERRGATCGHAGCNSGKHAYDEEQVPGTRPLYPRWPPTGGDDANDRAWTGGAGGGAATPHRQGRAGARRARGPGRSARGGVPARPGVPQAGARDGICSGRGRGRRRAGVELHVADVRHQPVEALLRVASLDGDGLRPGRQRGPGLRRRVVPARRGRDSRVPAPDDARRIGSHRAAVRRRSHDGRALPQSDPAPVHGDERLQPVFRRGGARGRLHLEPARHGARRRHAPFARHGHRCGSAAQHGAPVHGGAIGGQLPGRLLRHVGQRRLGPAGLGDDREQLRRL